MFDFRINIYTQDVVINNRHVYDLVVTMGEYILVKKPYSDTIYVIHECKPVDNYHHKKGDWAARPDQRWCCSCRADTPDDVVFLLKLAM
jgi:hypothetical protein